MRSEVSFDPSMWVGDDSDEDDFDEDEYGIGANFRVQEDGQVRPTPDTLTPKPETLNLNPNPQTPNAQPETLFLPQVHCIGLLNGGPAEQSGVLQTGDVLLKVDGIAVFGKTHSDVLDLIMGAADTLVELELLQGDAVRAFSKVTNACLKVTISYSDGTCKDS